MATALAAHRLAACGGDPDPVAVGRAALLHPIALWALSAVDPDRLAEWMTTDQDTDRSLLESDWFGRDAASFGFHLTRRWGCPPELSDAVLLAGFRAERPEGIAHDPVHLNWIRLGRSWAMSTPWALPGLRPPAGPTDDQRRWLIATVQAHCSGGFCLADDSIDPAALLRSSLQSSIRADHLDQELADLSERFRNAVASLDEYHTDPARPEPTSVLDAMAEFAAGAAHELNNPLAIIAGRAQLLQAKASDPDQRKALQTIIGQARRAHQMLRDLIYIARPPTPRAVPCVPDQILRGVVDDLTPDAQAREIRLSVRTSGSSRSVPADPDALRHLADALIRNAIEATPEGGSVLVTSLGDQESLVWTVQDNGIGLDEERAAHLLDPFYCGRQAGRGLGLGLPRVARFVQSVGGSITWQSPPEGGTVMRVELPVGVEAQPMVPPPQSRPHFRDAS